MLRLLRNVRKAYKQWRALPPDERAQFSELIRRIRGLVAELGGSRAVRFVDGTSDSADIAEPQDIAADRSRADIARDLQAATSELLSVMAKPAGTFAKNSAPRSVRLGGKVAVGGLRRIARRRHG